MKTKISVVVPVYKAEKYLLKCLDSILHQTYENIEIILVDDGSPDNSGKMCDEYAKKDNRIRVFHQKNSGVSSARNKGIEVAKGEYLTFIDADDFVGDEYINHLVKAVDKKIQTVCKIKKFSNENIKTNSKEAYRTFKLEKDAFIELSKLVLLNTPCCKLYNRDILIKNNIRFDENVSLGEDLLFNLDYLKYIDEVIVIDEYLYFYRRSEDTTLSTVYTPSFKDISIRLIKEYTSFFENLINKKEDIEHFDTNRLNMIIDVIQNEFRNKKVRFFQRYKNARSDLKDEVIKKQIKSLNHTNEKVTCFFLSHNMCLTYKIIDKIKNIFKGK